MGISPSIIAVYGKNEKGRRVFLGIRDSHGNFHKGVHKLPPMKVFRPMQAAKAAESKATPSKAKSKSKSKRRSR